MLLLKIYTGVCFYLNNCPENLLKDVSNSSICQPELHLEPLNQNWVMVQSYHLPTYILAHLLNLRSISSHLRTSLTNFRWKTFTSGLSCKKRYKVNNSVVSWAVGFFIILCNAIEWKISFIAQTCSQSFPQGLGEVGLICGMSSRFWACEDHEIFTTMLLMCRLSQQLPDFSKTCM